MPGTVSSGTLCIYYYIFMCPFFLISSFEERNLKNTHKPQYEETNLRRTQSEKSLSSTNKNVFHRGYTEVCSQDEFRTSMSGCYIEILTDEPNKTQEFRVLPVHYLQWNRQRYRWLIHCQILKDPQAKSEFGEKLSYFFMCIFYFLIVNQPTKAQL